MSEVLVNIFFYFITWWVVLFAVLPWGVRRVENPVEGHDPGAPEKAHLVRKLVATSLVSLTLWGTGFFIVKYFGFSILDLQSK